MSDAIDWCLLVSTRRSVVDDWDLCSMILSPFRHLSWGPTWRIQLQVFMLFMMVVGSRWLGPLFFDIITSRHFASLSNGQECIKLLWALLDRCFYVLSRSMVTSTAIACSEVEENYDESAELAWTTPQSCFDVPGCSCLFMVFSTVVGKLICLYV